MSRIRAVYDAVQRKTTSLSSPKSKSTAASPVFYHGKDLPHQHLLEIDTRPRIRPAFDD